MAEWTWHEFLDWLDGCCCRQELPPGSCVEGIVVAAHAGAVTVRLDTGQAVRGQLTPGSFPRPGARVRVCFDGVHHVDQRTMHQPRRPSFTPDDAPDVPRVKLATMHALDALLLSPHTRPPLPHAPLWDRGAGVTGPLYPSETTGQEHPPRVLLGTPGTTPPDTPDITTIAHLRNADRDPLLPYAAGIKDGRVYVRVHDLPAWGHHLRRTDGTDWPDDGATVWIWDRSLATSYRANEPDAIGGVGQEIDLDVPIIVFGEHAQEDGRLLYQTRTRRFALAEGPWRNVYGAQLVRQDAAVTRHYQDGEVAVEERTLPTVDVALRVPDITASFELAYNRFVDGVGISNVGYAATVAVTSAPAPRQRVGELAYTAQMGSLTWGNPDPRPNFFLLIDGGIQQVEVTRLPGVPISDDKLVPLVLANRSVRARFIPDDAGLPLADARDAPPQALLAGAVVYEGPLGVLPAPCSGLSATWAGLEVQAGGHFTADAWVDGSMLWACLVDAAGQVHVARQALTPPPGQPPQIQRWTYPAPAGLPGGTPVLSYSFLREGQTVPGPRDGQEIPAWPTRAGLLAWVDAEGTLTRVSVRTRHAGDPLGITPASPKAKPIAFERWPELDVGADPRVAFPLHPGTLAAPTVATLDGAAAAPLRQWQAPAPGEPGGAKPQLPQVTGSFALGWADPTGTGRARLASVTLLTTAAAAKTLSAHLAAPPGWTVHTDAAGPFVRVTLTPAALAPLTLTFTCTGLPIGQPRATLEAAPA